MVTIRRLPPSTIPVSSKPSITAKDAETAGKLKPAILDILSRVRMTQTPAGKQPTWDAKAGLYKAPNGKYLFPVTLHTPPPGSADMPTQSALVDPTTNTFYSMSSGGFTGASFFYGPLSLPKGVEFHHKNYSNAQLKLLAAAAAKADKPKPFHASPQVLSASYSGGMGVQPRDGGYAGPRVNVQVLFPNITYKPTWTVKLDEKTKTLTVVVDASSGIPESKVMARPVDLQIPVQRPATIGGQYTLLIKDYQGKVLNKSTFTNYLPM